MESSNLVIQRKAFQQTFEGLVTLRQEQTSSLPVIAKALQQLKVLLVSSTAAASVTLGGSAAEQACCDEMPFGCPPSSPLCSGCISLSLN